MKPAPLQLTDYFITELHLKANLAFDSDCTEQLEVTLDTLHISNSITKRDQEEDTSKGTMWNIGMKITQEIKEGETNIPYEFSLELQGIVFAFPQIPEDRLETVVSANAPAMLFGAAREIIRAATGRGPFPAVIIPSTNFLSNCDDDSNRSETTD